MAEHDTTRESSIANLFSTLLRDLSLLVRQEVQLAKTEAAESLGQVRRGAIALAAGGMVAFAGFLFLLLSAVYALQAMVPNWLAALIVGLSAVFVGVLLLVTGRGALRSDNLKPQRTIDSVREDTAVARQHLSRG